MEQKGALSMGILGLIVAIVLAGVVLIYISGSPLAGGGEQTGTEENPTVVTQKCQDDGTNSLFVAVKNDKNSSLHYSDNTLAILGEDGQIVVTGTATAGAALAYVTIAVPCSENSYKGDIVALIDTGDMAAIGTFDFDGDTADYATLLASPSGNLKIAGYDSTYTNTTDTSSADGAGAGCTETEADTNAVADIDAGGSFTRYYDIKQATAFKCYGSRVAGEPGMLITIDNQNASSWNAGDIQMASISGGGNLQKVDCSTYADETAALDADECWTMDAICSSDGTRRVAITGSANGGNPNSDLNLVFSDLGYFQDVDGGIEYGGRTSARGSVGIATDCSSVINIF